MHLLDRIDQILLPTLLRDEIVAHCRRKRDGVHLEGEAREAKAFGLVAGTRHGSTLRVVRIFPARVNARGREPFRTDMDRMMARYALPSPVPLSERGWVIDPAEIKEISDRCDREGLLIVGAYHVHGVALRDDSHLEIPTRLDGVLARQSNLFSFIVSLIDREHPVIRAFYEGVAEEEVPIRIDDDTLNIGGGGDRNVR